MDNTFFHQSQILLVDDEPSVLSSLSRLLRKHKINIVTADSGATALDILKKQSIDLIISDMRMPKMDGAELLQIVAKDYPETERILLTGYSDLESTIEAINKGKISRYLEKPWDDDIVIKVVKKGLELQNLRREREYLQSTIKQQNSELKTLNEKLEHTVEKRTQQLNNTLVELQNTHSVLRNSYGATIKSFSRLIDQRLITNSHLKRKITKLAYQIASALELTDEQRQIVLYASLLRNIGKLGLHDELLETPYKQLSPEQLKQFHQHPTIGEASLLAMPHLEETRQVLAQHKEYIDGSGYPSKLSSDDIRIEARILCVTSDFEDFLQGHYFYHILSLHEAVEMIKAGEIKHYDKDVVASFLSLVADDLDKEDEDQQINSMSLQSGMTLSRDLVTHHGTLLWAAGNKMDEHIVEKIVDFEKNLNETFLIYIEISQ